MSARASRSVRKFAREFLAVNNSFLHAMTFPHLWLARKRGNYHANDATNALIHLIHLSALPLRQEFYFHGFSRPCLVARPCLGDLTTPAWKWPAQEAPQKTIKRSLTWSWRADNSIPGARRKNLGPLSMCQLQVRCTCTSFWPAANTRNPQCTRTTLWSFLLFPCTAREDREGLRELCNSSRRYTPQSCYRYEHTFKSTSLNSNINLSISELPKK